MCLLCLHLLSPRSKDVLQPEEWIFYVSSDELMPESSMVSSSREPAVQSGALGMVTAEA